MDMADYIQAKLKDLKVDAKTKKRSQDQLTEKEKSVLKAQVMTLMWVAREARFDVLGAVGLSARRGALAKVEDLIECARIAVHLRETKDLGLVYMPVHPSRATFMTFTDAGLPEEGDAHPPGGLLVGIAEGSLKHGLEASINLVPARVEKLDRVCSSSLAAESYAMIAGMSCCEWVQFLYLEMSNALFTKDMLKNRLRQWRNSTPSRPFGGALAGALMAKANTDKHLKATFGHH